MGASPWTVNPSQTKNSERVQQILSLKSLCDHTLISIFYRVVIKLKKATPYQMWLLFILDRHRRGRCTPYLFIFDQDIGGHLFRNIDIKQVENRGRDI